MRVKVFKARLKSLDQIPPEFNCGPCPRLKGFFLERQNSVIRVIPEIKEERYFGEYVCSCGHQFPAGVVIAVIPEFCQTIGCAPVWARVETIDIDEGSGEEIDLDV